MATPISVVTVHWNQVLHWLLLIQKWLHRVLILLLEETAVSLLLEGSVHHWIFWVFALKYNSKSWHLSGHSKPTHNQLLDILGPKEKF